MEGLRKMSIDQKSVHYKLLIAFTLMTIIPILSLFYFIAVYIFPLSQQVMYQSSMVIFLVLVLAGLGYIVIRKIVLPLIKIASGMKIMSESGYSSEINVTSEDELGEIVNAINKMSNKMRNHIEQLQEYSDETAYLSLKIHKKANTLTHLMNLGDLINSGVSLPEMGDYAAEKITLELSDSFCAIFIRGKNGEYIARSLHSDSNETVATRDIEVEISLLEKSLSENDYLVVDGNNLKELWQERMHKRLGKINVVLLPMRLKKEVIGVIVFGIFGVEKEFTPEEIDILKAFEKELVLGYQSSQLLSGKAKVDKVVDELTGFYTFSYLEEYMKEELNRALYYQRPCSLMLISLDDHEGYVTSNGQGTADVVIKAISGFLGEMVPSVGKIARISFAEFGILLPEKNKKESLELAEEIRRKIEVVDVSLEIREHVTASIGVGENPIDGSTVKEIVSSARKYLVRAKARKNCVVGE
ncbi:MAG: diguanylate cyclase [Candidatus Omnitrophica bacterium]|nr:diguanylate cyclase [Candidatus Omnitrophota bacterium]